MKRYRIHGALNVDSIRLVSFILIVTSRRSLESGLYTIIIVVTNKPVDVGKHYLFGNQQIMPQFVPEHYIEHMDLSYQNCIHDKDLIMLSRYRPR